MADDEEEAGFYLRLFEASAPGLTLVEFGSGGGNSAFYMKRSFAVTLVDASEEMLAVSRAVNPDCERIAGDMRTVRPGRTFDRVFIHDAIDSMTTLEQLRQSLETAYLHCAPGGMALFVSDTLRENDCPGTECGCSDGEGRAAKSMSSATATSRGSSAAPSGSKSFVQRDSMWRRSRWNTPKSSRARWRSS